MGVYNIVVECEQCKNFIHVKAGVKELFDCPLCGCLNEYIEKTIMTDGSLWVRSPSYKFDTDLLEKGKLVFPDPDVPDYVLQALAWMMDNKWTVSVMVGKNDLR